MCILPTETDVKLLSYPFPEESLHWHQVGHVHLSVSSCTVSPPKPRSPSHLDFPAAAHTSWFFCSCRQWAIRGFLGRTRKHFFLVFYHMYLCHNFSLLLLSWRKCHKQNISECAEMCSNKDLFTQTGRGPDLLAKL